MTAIRCIGIFLCVFYWIPLSVASEKTPTGFYYPTKKDNYDRTYASFLANQCDPHRENYMHYYPNTGLYHIGQDIAGIIGDPVYAVAAGEILTPSTTAWGEANIAHVIKHELSDGSFFIGVYGHIQNSLPTGQTTVRAGEQIGIIGPHTFPHVHFGVYPSASRPTASRWGNMYCTEWPENGAPNTNGFVDPIEWIRTRTPKDVAAKSLRHPDGTLIRAEGDNTVYYLENGLKRGVPDEQTLLAMGRDPWRDVIIVSPEERDCYDVGPAINPANPPRGSWNGYPNGSLVRSGTDGPVFQIVNGEPHWLAMDEQDFRSFGYDPSMIKDAGSSLRLWSVINLPVFAPFYRQCSNNSYRCVNNCASYARATADPYRTRGANPSLTHTTDYVGPSVGVGIAPKPDCGYADQVGGRYMLASHDNMTFAVGDTKTVAFNPNGSVKWEKRLGWSALDGNTLYGFTCTQAANGNPSMPILVHYDKENGSHKKEIPLKFTDFPELQDCYVVSSTMSGDTIFLGAKRTLYALNRSDGSKRWEFATAQGMLQCEYQCFDPLERPFSLSPDGKTLYAVDNVNRLYALNAQTGQLVWSRHIDAGSEASSAIVDKDGTIFVSGWDSSGGSQKVLLALLPDGSTKWEVRKNDGIGEVMAVGPFGVYLKVRGSVFAHDKANGALLWVRDVGHDFWRNMTVSSDGQLYVLGVKLFMLDPQDGSIRASYGGLYDVLKGPGSSIAITPSKSIALMAFVNRDWSCFELFRANTRTLSVGYQGQGAIKTDPPGIDCPEGVCELDFALGMSLRIIPEPSSGWKVNTFGGQADCMDGLVAMNDDRSCEVSFVPDGNLPPVANAGADKEGNEGAVITLDGSGSADPEGKPLSFSWAQTQGAAAQLANPSGQATTVTLPSVDATTFLTFALTVSDSTLQGTDNVNVTVKKGPFPANSGSCSFAVSPTAYNFSGNGGSLAVSVNAPGGCAWGVSLPESWIHASPLSGSGSGAVTISADKNPSTAASRGNSVAIGDTKSQAAFRVDQDNYIAQSNCVTSVSPTAKNFPGSGGSVSVNVTAPSTCTWGVSLPESWIHASASSGTGSTTLTISVDQNPSFTASRGNNVTIGGINFRVDQDNQIP